MVPDIGRPFYRAVMTLDALAPIEPPSGAEGDSNSSRMWTRTQRVRTVAAIPIEAVMVERTEPPVYLQIAEKAKHLRGLRMSDTGIARALGPSDKTVATAVSYASRTISSPGGPERKARSSDFAWTGDKDLAVRAAGCARNRQILVAAQPAIEFVRANERRRAPRRRMIQPRRSGQSDCR